MNLRHIDPRSTDWMDAMEDEGTDKGRKREREPREATAEPTLQAAGKHTSSEAIGPPPPRR